MTERLIEALAGRRLQAWLVLGVLFGSALLIASSLLRFVPPLSFLAVGRSEPLWVLLLSEAALLVAALMGIPSLLAFLRADEAAGHSDP